MKKIKIMNIKTVKKTEHNKTGRKNEKKMVASHFADWSIDV